MLTPRELLIFCIGLLLITILFAVAGNAASLSDASMINAQKAAQSQQQRSEDLQRYLYERHRNSRKAMELKAKLRSHKRMKAFEVYSDAEEKQERSQADAINEQ